MARFNKRIKTEKTTNKAGGTAYRMGAEQELVHAVLTTFLEDKFYESGSERLERIKNLVRENKPEFVANLAVVARKEFHLRSVTHVLLGELSKFHQGDSLVRNAIVASTTRPDDLTELVSYVGFPLSKGVKRGVRNGILKFNRYQLAKYKGESKGVSLVDLFNLTHPKVQHANEEQKKAWKDLIEGNLVSFDTWETEISNAKNDKARTEAWEALIAEDKLGYMALLRNLNNLIKYKVNEKTIERAIQKLTDPEEVKNSKQLPFRYMTAYQNVAGRRDLSDAIAKAMDTAVANAPELSGNTLIAIDSSGSMTNGGLEGAIRKAAIFGATLFKANTRADMILYDTRIQKLNITGYAPVVTLAEQLEKLAMGGGTQTSLVFQHAVATGKKYDRIIILSDNESWNERSVQPYYNEYKKITGDDPYVYAIDIQGYGTKDITGNRVFHLTGWSDRVLDFIGKVEEGESLVEYIKNYGI